MKVELPKPRSAIADSADGLQITIPAKRNIFLVAFLGLWLVGWTFGEVMGFRTLASAVVTGEFPGPGHLFLIAWLAAPWGGITVGLE